MTESNNALIKQYSVTLAMSNASLEVHPDALNAIAAEARRKGTGARGLRSIMDKLLMDAMFLVPEVKGRCTVVLDKEGVISKTGAHIVEADGDPSCCDAEVATGS
jgi:ATP-dependent Clp protease ATP-binding subunit ClpX